MQCIGAVEEYEEVQRELSRISRAQTNENDAEKGAVEEFNLTEFLSGMSSEAQQSGVKPKHLGVIWKNLTVEVLFFISRGINFSPLFVHQLIHHLI